MCACAALSLAQNFLLSSQSPFWDDIGLDIEFWKFESIPKSHWKLSCQQRTTDTEGREGTEKKKNKQDAVIHLLLIEYTYIHIYEFEHLWKNKSKTCTYQSL